MLLPYNLPQEQAARAHDVREKRTLDNRQTGLVIYPNVYDCSWLPVVVAYDLRRPGCNLHAQLS